MSLPNPGMSFTPFDPLPASDLNDMVENIEALAAGTGLNDDAVTAPKIVGIDKSNLTTDSNPYKFSAYCSSGKTVSTTTVIVDYQTELYDTNNNFASSRYTAPVNGFYHFDASAWWGSAGAASTEWASIHFRKNGSATNMPSSARLNGQGDASRYVQPEIHTDLQLTAGDYIEVFMIVSGSRDIVASIAGTRFSGNLICRT